jgi:hypothetical protein
LADCCGQNFQKRSPPKIVSRKMTKTIKRRKERYLGKNYFGQVSRPRLKNEVSVKRTLKSLKSSLDIFSPKAEKLLQHDHMGIVLKSLQKSIHYKI